MRRARPRSRSPRAGPPPYAVSYRSTRALGIVCRTPHWPGEPRCCTATSRSRSATRCPSRSSSARGAPPTTTAPHGPTPRSDGAARIRSGETGSAAAGTRRRAPPPKRHHRRSDHRCGRRVRRPRDLALWRGLRPNWDDHRSADRMDRPSRYAFAGTVERPDDATTQQTGTEVHEHESRSRRRRTRQMTGAARLGISARTW